jgi:hypothetical protein
MGQRNGRANYQFKRFVSPLVNRKQRMVEHPIRHLVSYRLTVVTLGSEVNARKDSGILYFVQRLRETPEGAGHADQEIIVDREMPPFAKEAGKHHCRRAADRRVARRVFRKRRRVAIRVSGELCELRKFTKGVSASSCRISRVRCWRC